MQSGAKAAPFPGLQEHMLRELSGRAVTRSFPGNTVIISEGDATDALYVVLSGKVKVFLANENGKEVLLNVEGPGEYFGEMILDGGPRSASVMTLEPSRFLVVPRSDVEAFLTRHPQFAMGLILKLIKRVRVLTDNVKSLALQDVYGRVARMLQELAVEQDGKRVVAEKPTQQEMASRIGASREMVSIILKDLARGGYIEIAGKRIIINKKLPLEW
jgi:CRP/FNR family transcriptional regulator, cyclic AMP receptor protein